MNKFLAVITAMLLCASAQAKPGENWEITSKMEMPGMPFAMPATTQQVCIPKGSESDPGKTSGDKDCKMSDIKTVGNKTTWKARCEKNGEVMIGVGEQTTTSGAYQGNIKFSGKSGGRDMNMSMVYSGKKIGGSCDTEAQMNAQMNEFKSQVCDTSQYENTAQWIAAAPGLILVPGAACADQRGKFCEAVKRDAPRDVKAYTALMQSENTKIGGASVVKECKLDLAATTKSICKKLDGNSYRDLTPYCPAEAKKYRETVRRKECEGRSYTAETRAEELKRCLNGEDDSPVTPSSPDNTSSGKTDSDKSVNDALEAAKKLRSKFGF